MTELKLLLLEPRFNIALLGVGIGLCILSWFIILFPLVEAAMGIFIFCVVTTSIRLSRNHTNTTKADEGNTD